MTDVTIQQNIVTVVETNTSPTVRAQQTTVTVTPTTSGVAVTPTTSAVTITAATPTTAVTVAPTSVAVTVPTTVTLLTVEEQDGSPSVTNVSKLRVSNGTLTNNGGGVVTVVTGSGVGGGATVLDDLTDVTLTLPSNTQVLMYNGAGWVNATNAPAFSAITGKPTTLSGYGITDAASLSAFNSHVADTSNPHVVTLAQVGGAPVGAKYIVQTADSTLTNEQALGALATGLLKNTTSTGVLSIAVGDTDYTLPATFSAHTGNTSNPHGVTAAQVGAYTTAQTDTLLAGKASTSHTHAASDVVSGQLALARGGTGADLSATGGANQVVKQTSAGGVLTVGALVAGDIPSLDSGKITSGEIPRSPLTTRGDLLTRDATTHTRLALGSAGKFVRSDGTDPSWQLLVAGDIPSLDASKITSGTLATARLGSGTANSTTYLRGDSTWQTISAGGVSGSGTSGRIAQWSSSSAIGDSTLIKSNSEVLYLFYDSGTNVGIGSAATLANLTTGSHNFAIGDQCLNAITTERFNVAVGTRALATCQGEYNFGFGYRTLDGLVGGSKNVAIGSAAGFGFTSGDSNIFIGFNSGNAGGSNLNSNVCVGDSTGFNLTTNSHDNVFLGDHAGYNESGSSRLYIEPSTSTRPLIYGEFNTDLVRINGMFELNEISTPSAPSNTNARLFARDNAGKTELCVIFEDSTVVVLAAEP